MKRLARVTALILMTIGGVVLIWLFSNTVLLFLLSLVIAAAVRPLAARLIDRGLNRALAYGLAYLTGLLCLISLIVVAGSGLLAELELAGNQLLEAYNYVTINWPNGEMWQQRIASELPEQKDLIGVMAGEQGTSFFSGIIGFGSGLFDFIAQLVVALSLSVYWATDRERFERLWLSLVYAKYRPRARTIWRLVEWEVGAYVRSEVTQSSLAGITLGLAYAALGLPYPILLALWAALVWLIPWVGVLLALIPATLVGLLVGWQYATIAALITLVVFGVMETWLEPRLYGRARVSPVLVVITLMVMAQYAGILGMLLAPPLAATLQILGRELWFTPAPKVVAPDMSAQLIELRSRLAALRLEQNVDFATNVQARSLASRIEELLDKTHETLDANGLMPSAAQTPKLDPVLTQNANPTPATQQ